MRRQRAGGMWVLLMLLWALSVSAQETTDDVPFGWTTTVRFPEAIVFDLASGLPGSAISHLELAIRPPESELILTRLEPSDFLEAEPFTFAQVIWRIPRAEPPQLFESVPYSWRMVLNDGQAFQIDASVIFTDTRVDWVRDEDPEGRVDLILAAHRPDAEQLRESANRAAALVHEHLPQVAPVTLMGYAVPIACDRNADGEPVIQLEDETIACDLTFAEQLYRESDILAIDLPVDPFAPNLLVDALVERAYNARWGSRAVPDWFAVGLRAFHHPVRDAQALPLLRQTARQGRLLDLDAMRNRPDEPALQTLWDAQSHAMVLYLADRFGVPAIFQLAADISPRQAFTDAYAASIGLAPAVLLAELQTWLLNQRAERAFRYTPYLPTTPTATPTPSITPSITPSTTPTPTLPATPTPSVTPSITPSVTPTPSITPRPAQRFVVQRTPTITPSPTPAPPPPNPLEVVTSPSGLTIIAGGLLILAALAFVGLRLNNNP